MKNLPINKQLSKRLMVYLIPVLLLIIMLDVFTYWVIAERQKQQQILNLQSKLSAIRAQLEGAIQKDLQVMNSMAAFIYAHESIDLKHFRFFVSELMKLDTNINNISVSEGYTIKYTYPVEANKAIIGKDYRNIKKQWPMVKKVIDTKKIFVTKPIDLIQGGRGIIGRYPVYFSNGSFYGIVSVVIDFDAAIARSRLMCEEFEIDMAIRGSDGSESLLKVFFGSAELFSDPDSVKMDIHFQGGSWQIAGMYRKTEVAGFFSYVYVHGIFLFLLIIASLLIRIKISQEMKLALSESRFRDFTLSSADWVWETDAQGRYIYASGNVKNILGYSPEELIGKTPFDLMDEEESSRVAEIFKKIITEKKRIKNLENWNYTRDNKRICLQTSGVPVFDLKGNLTGYRGVDRDITDEKKARQDLVDREELLNLFFRQSLDGFFFMMLDEPVEWNDQINKEEVLEYAFSHQRITKINRAMLDQYKAEEKDFLGLTPADFFEHNVEHGKKTWRELFDNGRLHVATNEKRFDGSDIIIEGDYICIYDEKKRIKGHFGVQRDITKEKVADYELQKYIDIVNENVIISKTDLDGTITYVSKAFCESSGYEPEELIYKNHNVIRHSDMPENVFEDLWSVIKKNNTWNGEMKNRAKDGRDYWVNAYISPIFDIFSQKHGYMAIMQDITSKKRIEALSITDSLTGIYNRLKLDQFLHLEFNRYERYSEPLSIILFDIDFFKKINDRFGHLIGDNVLKKIAHIASENIRKTDIVGRWGGEEFLIICPHINKDGVNALAEKIRVIVEKFDFGEVGTVTASFGTASSIDAKNTAELLKSADDALYAAKDAGRNCVKAGY